MKFKVILTTSGGGKRELELPATSVQDAIDQAKESYPGCNIKAVDLIPQGHNTTIIFSYGEQYEVGRSLIYDPWKE